MKPKILFYDLETTPLLAYIWRPGKQVVRHGQLAAGSDRYDIICITYCWNDGKPAKSLDWGPKQNSKPMLREFDKILKTADVVIGKNSDRFDNKHLNTHRWLNNEPGMPDWTKYTDDLEKQLRKYFYLPSFSLDYVSKMLGLGGKDKMEMQDWVDIVERNDPVKLKKMIKYGKKDVEDTRAVWLHASKHFEPKYNAGLKSAINGKLACTNCGSLNVVKNGTRQLGQTLYQVFKCNDHHGHAGRATIKKDGSFGKLV